MSGFGAWPAVPFVPGSLYGIRAFEVDSTGHLHAPVKTYNFQPGENIATCPLRRDNELMWGGARHHVAAMACSCGFYAHYDGSSTHSSGTNITAMVEGYGRVTYGDYGFRAEKLRIVAIYNPHLNDDQVIQADEARVGTRYVMKLATRYRLGALAMLLLYVGILTGILIWDNIPFWAIGIGWVLMAATGFVCFKWLRDASMVAQRTRLASLQNHLSALNNGPLMKIDSFGSQFWGEDVPPRLYRLAAAKYVVPQYGSLKKMTEDFPIQGLKGMPREHKKNLKNPFNKYK